jgi:hypothetical protein
VVDYIGAGHFSLLAQEELQLRFLHFEW